jgi:uncharacterized repeat protein (TIGR03803 family)
LALILAEPLGAASTYKVLYTFGALPDAEIPTPGLVLDSAGNLYGTTQEGGTGTGCGANAGCGTVFKLTPNQDGSWTETILFNFLGDSATGAFPGGLSFDSAGNLYGTTATGGPCDDLGCGSVFKLTPNSDGSWTHTVLFEFPGLFDGTFPTYGLTFGAGSIYGSTSEGGFSNCGTIYRLSPNHDGNWTHTVLYNFTCDNLVDGSNPSGGLFLGKNGALFGTLLRGGSRTNCTGLSCGSVFMLAKNPSGIWTYQTLYSFTGGADGGSPQTGLAFHAGKLFGATYSGGDLSCGFSGCGVLFELVPSNAGWTEKVIHTFEAASDGAYPVATPTFDAAGTLYSASQQIGGGMGYGAVLKGTSAILHDFRGRQQGEYPNSLTLDSVGNIYGTAPNGGFAPCGVNPSFGCGVVFEITPQ